MNPSKGSEERNPQGDVEIKVETVDYRSPAGEETKAKKENVEVIHQYNDADSSTQGKGGTLAGAAAAVAQTFQSAKDATLGRGKDTAK